MFNDRLSNEVAKERIQQRMKEVESYSQQKRLGFSEYGIARWVFAFVMLAAAVVALAF